MRLWTTYVSYMRVALAAMGATFLVAFVIGCGGQHLEPQVAGRCLQVSYSEGGRHNIAYAGAVDRVSENRVIARYVVTVNQQPHTRAQMMDITARDISIREGSCEH